MPVPVILLASASPRRRELLAAAGVAFRVVPSAGEEVHDLSVPPSELAERNACAKAVEVSARHPGDLVLGADTLVVVDGHPLGKPADRAECLATLVALSGREHQVLTAVALASAQRIESRVVASRVRFRPLRAGEAEAYWATGEPCDKAGSYGIQGLAAVFVSQLEGSYSAVVGLPLCETAQLLGEFGIPCWQA